MLHTAVMSLISVDLLTQLHRTSKKTLMKYEDKDTSEITCGRENQIIVLDPFEKGISK